MKWERMKKGISIICSLTLLAGVYSGIQCDAAGKTDTAKQEEFSCYLEQESFYAGNEQKEGTYYGYDAEKDTFTRGSNDSGWSDYKVAFLFTKQKYQNFALDFDVTFDAAWEGETWLWFEFGKQTIGQTTSLDPADGAVIAAVINGGANRDCYLAWEKSRDAWGSNYNGFDVTETHHVRLLVNEGKYSLIVDNLELFDNRALPDNYQAGYVGIGTGCPGVSYSNLSIDFQDITELFNGYSAYHSNTVNTFYLSGMQKTVIDTDWKYCGNGMILRKENGGSGVLYSSESYQDFVMDFDFTARQAGTTEEPILVGVGAQNKGEDWLTSGSLKNPSCTVLRIYPNGIGQYAPTDENAGDGWLSGAGVLYNTTAQYGAVHHARIQVQGDNLILQIDGKTQGTIAMKNYSGGYIFLSGSFRTNSFSVPSIETITDPSDIQISFEGGSIRIPDTYSMSGTADEKAEAVKKANLRFGYNITLPEGKRMEDVDWRFEWKVSGKANTRIVTGVKYVKIEGEANTYRTNLVITNIPMDANYDTTIEASLKVSYKANETNVLTDAVKTRSVRQVAEAIKTAMESGECTEPDAIKDYVTTLTGKYAVAQ